MRKTLFAGLTVLEPGESLQEDGYAFQSQDRETIDRFLEIGAVTHRHNARLALESPTASAGASAVASGGSIRAGEEFFITYTLRDEENGETLEAPAVNVTMPEPIETPVAAPSGEADYTGGVLPTDTYYYAISILDGEGGETPVGPWVQVEREPGFASGQVNLSGLSDIVASGGGAAWALYKATAGGAFYYIAEGTDDEFTDDGTFPSDCNREPVLEGFNTTNGDNSLVVNIPSAAMIDSNSREASAFRIYISRGGEFQSPSLAGTYPSGSAGVDITYTAFEVFDGQPPDVSTCVRGASLIDPDTELLDWHWKRPVDTVGDLPEPAEEGDVRMVLDEGVAYAYIDGAWAPPPGAADIFIQQVAASGSGSVTPASAIMFEGSGGTTIQVTDASGSAVVKITGGAGGGGGTDEFINQVAASGSGSVAPASAVMFRGSGNAEVSASAIGGSAVVTIFASGVPGPPGDPGDPGADGLQVRASASAATPSIASAASASGTIALASGWRLYRINTSRAARVRLYPTDAHRAADAGRAIGTDPTGDHGCLFEFITTTGDLDWTLSPLVDGFNDPAGPNTYYNITNMDATGVVTVTFLWIRTE